LPDVLEHLKGRQATKKTKRWKEKPSNSCRAQNTYSWEIAIRKWSKNRLWTQKVQNTTM